MSKDIWGLAFPDGRLIYVDGDGVVSIKEFDEAGPMGCYPWYRVEYESGLQRDVNSLHVEYVEYLLKEK